MMILRILKYLFFSMISLLVITLAIVYINLDYKMYPLKANQELYSKNIWEIDTDSLAEELLKKMTLEEKIDQMYGEKMYKSIPKFFQIIMNFSKNIMFFIIPKKNKFGFNKKDLSCF